ncbi:hypothetical protein COX18_10395 [Candidatus Desantisbacteria bacterium CG23_combo_of_CG06-09_8_20_14_all_40_23]|uniref:Uncharacterized protein n=1 Tax=Candidatus Desantisbacteria bacterium CG23_combo_of_CG06-09_8_20_14_all_40_23 TaxID=1974550 RepID=A0A2H0A1N7_9BACT|nr:MAG: hypothetical protein COX18_10395 [Candidatus Desantisbacteria bacterium CG23_combo_of_CG06-09_8_20_14_all_40_23]
MAAFEVYVLFENLSTVGKYITNLYTADDTATHDLALPSGSVTYTLPGASDTDEKEAYLVKDVIVIGTPTVKYLEIWLNDKDSSDVVVLGVNTGATVNRQFEKMEYIIGEGTPIKFKQK